MAIETDEQMWGITLAQFKIHLKSLPTKFWNYPLSDIRSDNDNEFVNQIWYTYLHKKGIQRSQIPPFSPEINDLVEKTNHIIITEANSSLIPTDMVHYNVIYGYTIFHATKLLNIIPVTSKFRSPYEMLFHIKLKSDSLLNFGWDAIKKALKYHIRRNTMVPQFSPINILNQSGDSNSWYLMCEGNHNYA